MNVDKKSLETEFLATNGNRKDCFYRFLIRVCRLLRVFSIAAYPVWDKIFKLHYNYSKQYAMQSICLQMTCMKWQTLFSPKLRKGITWFVVCDSCEYCFKDQFISAEQGLMIKSLTLCMLGILHAFCRLLIVFKINLLEKLFQEYHQSVNQFGSRSGPTLCRAWSGSKLFVKVISRRR